MTDASDGKTSAAIEKINTSSSFVSGTEIDKNVAYYPYSSAVGIAKNATGYTISGIELPATQEYAEGSFGNGAFPMAAVTGSTTDKTLKFKNVLGGLKLQLTGSAKIASIAVTGNADEILCGSANVTVSSAAVPKITLTDTDADAKTVTLDCGTAGVQLNSETATTFIIALPPMTMASGFTVTVTDTNGRNMKIETTKSQTIARSNLLVMSAVTYSGTVQDYSKEPFTITAMLGTSTVTIAKVGSPDDITLEYRKNADEWTAYNIGDAISLSVGEFVQFRAGEGGNSTFSQSSSNYYTVSSDSSNSNYFSASGNIMSLYDSSLSKTTMTSYGFYQLFYGCKSLRYASNLILPATTMAESCYRSMFYGCCWLTKAPELPATTVADFCYNNMFCGCSVLETAPKRLPAMTLASFCYSWMFSDCSCLWVAPELPATTLADDCYNSMFKNCNLTTAPKLPATKLASACYYGMFYNCEFTTAPDLPAKDLELDCYTEMFYGCYNLNSIKAVFTTEPSDTYTGNWLSGVASTGTFVKSKDATWNVTGVNGVPEGWTVTTE